MATTPKPIIPGSLLTGSAATYYTCPASTRCVVKKLIFCNTEAATPYTVTVYRVPSGGSAGSTNIVVNAHAIDAAESWECYQMENHILAPGDLIQAFCSTNAKVAITGSGIEIV